MPTSLGDLKASDAALDRGAAFARDLGRYKSMAEKQCFKCNQTKPIDEFYKHPMMGDGHLNKCKECARKDVRENRAAKRQYYSDYDAARAQRPERKANSVESQRRRRAANPDKNKARRMIGYYVRTGKIAKQPCEKPRATKKRKG